MSDKIVSTDETTTQFIDADGGTLTLLSTGSIVSTGMALSNSFRDDITITVGGLAVGTSGAEIAGSGTSVLRVTETGTLQAYSGTGIGVLFLVDNAFVFNDGSILAEGRGISIQQGQSTITNGGTIQSNRNIAIEYELGAGSGPHILSNSGSVEGEIGVSLDGELLIASNSGHIFGRELGIRSIETITKASLSLTNSGVVEGGLFDGISLISPGDISNSGRITGLGQNGITFRNDEPGFGQNATVTNTETGLIEGKGANGPGSGINVESLNLALDNAGEIYGRASGVRADNSEEVVGVDAVINNSGRIVGTNASGIEINDYREVDIQNYGEVSSTQGVALLTTADNAVNSGNAGTLFSNNGVISGSIGGLTVTDRNLDFINTGLIEVTSEFGFALSYNEGTQDRFWRGVNDGQIISLGLGGIVSAGNGELINSGEILTGAGQAIGFSNINNSLGQFAKVTNTESGVIGSPGLQLISIFVQGFSFQLDNAGDIKGVVSIREQTDAQDTPIAATADILNSGTMSGSIAFFSEISSQVTNTGSMLGSTGIWLDGQRDAGLSGVIENSGEIVGQAGFAIFIDNMSGYVFNDGTISGELTGIAFREDVASTLPAFVVNTGTISGLFSFGIEMQQAGGTVVNSGTIQGGAAAIAGADDADRIENSGLILGDINLGAGEDVYDGMNLGTVAGDVNGGAGDDTLLGGIGDDTFFGGDDRDIVAGRRGDDTLNGGAGGDILDGARGNDTLIGGSGGDTLRGGAGDDVLEGGEQDDRLIGGSGEDTLDGGLQNDILEGGSGNDVLLGNNGADRLFGGDDSDILNGGGGDDTLEGGSGDDILEGGIGADTLLGGSGDDQLFGNNFLDVLDGGHGLDTLTGGGGADTFVFSRGYERDTITDFAANATDLIDLSTWGLSDVSQLTLVQSGSATVIDFGAGDVLTLNNTLTGDLDNTDFIFV